MCREGERCMYLHEHDVDDKNTFQQKTTTKWVGHCTNLFHSNCFSITLQLQFIIVCLFLLKYQCVSFLIWSSTQDDEAQASDATSSTVEGDDGASNSLRESSFTITTDSVVSDSPNYEADDRVVEEVSKSFVVGHLRPEEWVKASAFVPGQLWKGLGVCLKPVCFQ